MWPKVNWREVWLVVLLPVLNQCSTSAVTLSLLPLAAVTFDLLPLAALTLSLLPLAALLDWTLGFPLKVLLEIMALCYQSINGAPHGGRKAFLLSSLGLHFLLALKCLVKTSCLSFNLGGHQQ